MLEWTAALDICVLASASEGLPRVLLWRRLGVEAGQRAFGLGVQAGLALTVLCVFWERLASRSSTIAGLLRR